MTDNPTSQLDRALERAVQETLETNEECGGRFNSAL